MLKRLLAVALVGAAACSSSTGHASASVHASPSAATTPTVTVVSPSPTPTGSTADLPLSTVGFSCRLPVVTWHGSDFSWTGGFITFPSGTYAPDPAGVINAIGDGELATGAKPTLMGYALGSLFYDPLGGRWLPAASEQTSPNGATYAFANPPFGGSDQSIDVVTVATGGVQRFSVKVPSDGTWQVGDFDGQYVYLVDELDGRLPTGIWRLDAKSGALVALAQLQNVFAVRSGSAWIGYVDPHDPNPPQAAGGPLFDSLVQVNLATGARTTWFYRPGFSVWLLGIDGAGRPVVGVSSGPTFNPSPPDELRRLTDPLSGGEDNGDLIYAGPLTLDTPQADGNRIWFGGEGGIYLYTSAAGLQKVYTFTSGPTTGQTISPAGVCT